VDRCCSACSASPCSAPAGRWRCGARSLVGWAPFIALVFRDSVPLALWDAACAIGIVGFALACLWPTRGPADRIVGTVLVPK
jgi:hypothetical protein